MRDLEIAQRILQIAQIDKSHATCSPHNLCQFSGACVSTNFNDCLVCCFLRLRCISHLSLMWPWPLDLRMTLRVIIAMKTCTTVDLDFSWPSISMFELTAQTTPTFILFKLLICVLATVLCVD